jgi:hypothetical protein
LVLVPLYLLVAYGLYHTCAALHRLAASRAPRLLPALLVVAVLFTSLYQANNYFGYPKDPGAGNMAQKHVYEDVIREYLRADPDGRVLYHEAAPFNIYSYVLIRWLGQEDLRAMLEDGRLTFLRSDNLEWVRREIQAGTYDLIVSTEPRRLEALIPEVVPLLRYTEERFQAYGTEEAARLLPFQP